MRARVVVTSVVGALALVGQLALLGTAGCFSVAQRREDTLIKQARTFNDDWRWARWDAMATMMPREDAAAFRKRVETLEEQLVLADFEVTSIDFGPGGDSATVVANFEWYLKRDPTVRKTTVTERWEFKEGQWLVVSLRRARGERFGLVTEPVAPPVIPDGGASR